MTLTKPCVICKAIITKTPRCTLENWKNRKKFCSVKCRQEGSRRLMMGNKHSLGVKKSEATLLKQSLAQRGEKGSNWRGDNVGYVGLHEWLYSNFGKASRCENPACVYPRKGAKKMLLKPWRYEWALRRGKPYKRDREHFIQLCIAC